MKQHTKRASRHIWPMALCLTLWCGTACSTAYAQQNDAPASQDADAPVVVDGPKIDANDTPPAVVPGEQTVRERVEFLLSGYEYFPTRSDLDDVAIAAQMTPVLQAISVDGAMAPTMKSRAVDALGYYEDEATVVHLRKLALTETVGLPRKELRAARALRYHAITSFARAAGADALGDLQGLMSHDEMQVQLSAISAIGKHCGGEGKQTLQARQDTEQDQVVLRELRKHTGR